MVIILGAAGRDFHNFNVIFRNDPSFRVVAFTATQIPGIEGRKYPAYLAGPLYPDGIPIFPEEDLPRLIAKHGIQTCLFAYSDVEYGYLGHRIALANAAGGDFRRLGSREAMRNGNAPFVAIPAVPTEGCKGRQPSRGAAPLAAARKNGGRNRHSYPSR